MADGLVRAGPAFRLLANMPLPKRRLAFRGLYLGSRLAGRPWRSGLAPSFRKVLRLPARTAERLGGEAAFFDWLAELEWLALLARSRAGIRRDLARVRVDHPETIARIAATGRPVVLAPLHMGAYTGCLAELMFRFFPGRPLLILRRRDDMPVETAVMERIRSFGVDMRFLKVTDRGDYLSAMRFAKAGAVIVVFCDLPPAFGMPASVPLFGQPFSFAFGLDAVARLTDALVLPLATVAGLAGDEVRVGQPFESRTGPAGRAHAVAHIRAHLESALTAAPEQWHLWSTLAEYLPPHGSVAPAGSDAAQPPALAEAAE